MGLIRAMTLSWEDYGGDRIVTWEPQSESG